MYTRNEKIVPIYIEEEMKDSYINYAMSVIVGRALPDVRDGLKPVHRRILYAMQDLHLEHSKPYKKSARIVGECLGKYHPHGDMAVYDTLVRMVQDFSLRYPLVDGQGNFGCFTKDTKIKLTDGRNVSFGDLIRESKTGKKNYAYTYKGREKHIEMAEIKKPRLTTKNAKLIEVKLDNNEKIKCTPKHRFMLRTGEYKEAQHLKAGDSLMPLYTRVSTVADDPNISGYEMIYQPAKDKWEYTHRLADEWNIKQGRYSRKTGRIRHHLDFNKLNNNPDNIRRSDWTRHWQAHYQMTAERHKNDPGYVRKLAQGRKKYWNTNGTKEKYSKLFKKLNAKNWKNPGQAMSELSKKRWQKSEYRDKQSKRIKKQWKNPLFRAKYLPDHFSTMAKKLWENPLTRENHRNKARQQWEDRHFRENIIEAITQSNIRRVKKNPQLMKELAEKAKTALHKNWKNETYKKKVIRSKVIGFAKRLLKEQKALTPQTYERFRTNNGVPSLAKALNYFSDFREIENEAKAYYNHKVKSIRILKKREDVYDLTIDDTHNFALASGIFVHNSIDGDAAAAMRYTEARLEHITDLLLQDIEKNTVKFVPNFDNSLTEPSVLPAVLPNLIINGSSGIAVGMATNIPPHNLKEVIEGIMHLIDNPDCAIKDLMKKIKGPDFPTGGIICGKEGIAHAYETGRGRLLVHAKASIEEQKSGKENIVITEIPYQVNKNNLITSIANLVQDKKIEGITDLRDESDKDGMRIVVELRRGQNAQIVLNQLYKHTQMQTTFGVIMLALVNNRPQVLNLKEMLTHYINHRKDVIIKRTVFDKEKAEARAHILEGLKIALKNLDRVIKIIKTSKDPETARKELISKFDLSEKQAQAILEMQLQRLTNLERAKIDNEYKELIKLIEYLNSILASEKKVLGLVKDELGEINKKFGDERRTALMGDVEDLEMEDLIQEEDVVITISHSGYIKRLPVGAYRKQKRGGKGVTGAGMTDEDFIEDLFVASTHDNVLFFTDKGKAYVVKVYDIPQAGKTAKGRAIVNMLSIATGERVTSSIPVKEFDEKRFLVMATEEGKIKKTKLSAFANIRKSGIIAISLAKEDSLITAKLTSGKDEMFIATKEGKAIRFNESNVRDMGRSAAGVRGINLAKKDGVIGAEIISDKKANLLSVTENGFSKRTELQEYRIQSRGGKGIINLKVTDKNGPVIGLNVVSDKDDLMIITSKGMVVRCAVKDVRATGRSAQGVRIIKLAKGDKVVSVARLIKEEEEENTPPSSSPA